jgi:pyruvate,water dikinase
MTLFHHTDWVVPFENLRMQDIEMVGGKNASLGEMIAHLPDGLNVPTGFATTAYAFRQFLQTNRLDEKINHYLDQLNVEEVASLTKAGAEIRGWVENQPFPRALEDAIRQAFHTLQESNPEASFAIRSSATAEDLPDASFAGQQETILNVSDISQVLTSIKGVFASLYNDRAISYRVHKGFKHANVALSVGVQRMVRSDLAVSGVMFTIDTESGFSDVVFITSSYGLGETIVQGAVNPDEFYVHKPMLKAGKRAVIRRNLGSKLEKMVFTTPEEKVKEGRLVKVVEVPEIDRKHFSLHDHELEQLAKYALLIESHYGCAMDIEWAKDGKDNKLYILQARPETVKSQQKGKIEYKYTLKNKGTLLTQGRAIGQKIGTGLVRLVRDPSHMDKVKPGDVLVADMTDPNWEPVMKRASAIITNRGGRTCHAAIIARELGIPAVVGCGNATSLLSDDLSVTVSCAEGDTGYVYKDILEVVAQEVARTEMPDIPTKIMMNVGNPQLAFDFAMLPNNGVGLARLEFIINNNIGIHPQAILAYPQVAPDLKVAIETAATGYTNPQAFYEAKIAEGIATIAAAFWPKPVIVRLSDFKSNEYRKLIGGSRYEPEEENPMLGFRGASRYISKDFRSAFTMECRAVKKVRELMGFSNVEIMVPFVRTLKQAAAVTTLLAEEGLKRGEQGLRLIMMCELPSNAVLAEGFLKYFDGFSIGSNDLTQLGLGLDRDSGLDLLAQDFDERDPAIKAMLRMAIQACKTQNKYVGICGQGPSDHPDFATWLVKEGINSLSLNPDTVVQTWQQLSKISVSSE